MRVTKSVLWLRNVARMCFPIVMRMAEAKPPSGCILSNSMVKRSGAQAQSKVPKSALMHGKATLSPTDLTCDPHQPDRAFDEPWQAQAFGLVIALYEQDAFTWSEWAAALSAVIAAEQNPDHISNSEYYRCWLQALEHIVVSKGMAEQEAILDVTQAWHRAAHATPQGSPITLENDPQTVT